MRITPATISTLLALVLASSCASEERTPDVEEPGAPPVPEKVAPPLEATSIEAFEEGLRAAEIWFGGPEERFAEIGRGTLALAIENGLNPDGRVLDIGAGSLRVGWWFLHYIEPKNYHAVEPVKSRIDTAVQLIGADINVYYNSDWEFPAVEFDLVIARSIWTHAAKWMISKMLSEFAENSAPDGKFLTSVKLARYPSEDYQGDEWVGRIEKSDAPGLIRHSLSWMKKECKAHGLELEVMGELGKQTWILITRIQPDPAGLDTVPE